LSSGGSGCAAPAYTMRLRTSPPMKALARTPASMLANGLVAPMCAAIT
jgi:hypothetical protein